MENNALDLGTRFCIDPERLSDNRADYTVAQLLSALNATTTLTELYVSGRALPPLSQQLVVEPICRCLANLWLQNKRHPLQKIQFYRVESGIIRQFLVALKQFGIRQVNVYSAVEPFSVHCLVDFCRDNSNLKVLELHGITFNDEVVADPIGGSATNLHLDTLVLSQLNFTTSFAATNFAHLLSHMSVSALKVGRIHPQVASGVDEDVGNDEDSITKRIVSGFKMPAVERLILNSSCRVKNFHAALDPGMATVTRLTVDFERYREDGATTEKLESLTRMIQGAVKLNSLTIQNFSHMVLSPPRQLLQALEACPTVTEIEVNRYASNLHDFTESEVRQLRRITTRNSELGRFLANPNTFPDAKLLTLMLQFNKCPSGLYLLARRLPEVFSFAKGNTLFPLMVEPNPTRRLRKRRTISYKE